MRLNTTIENFYISILEYANLKLDDNEIIVHRYSDIIDFTPNGRAVTLPYLDKLKDPKGKSFFHLLNENYTDPETSMFELYREHLSLAINSKLGSLISSVIAIASDSKLQARISDPNLEELIANVGEADLNTLDNFLKMVRLSIEENGSTSQLVDIYIKKNGKYKEKNYSAIGKINFKLYKDLKECVETSTWKLYNRDFRKKDILFVYNTFKNIFPNIEDQDTYTEATVNNVFRYLNVLLKTSYLITSVMNDVLESMSSVKHESVVIEEAYSNHDWTNLLSDLYTMSAEIRTIPNQTDISEEAMYTPTRLNVDESAAATQQPAPQPQPVPQQQYQQPSQGFNPAVQQQVQQQQQYQQPQVQQEPPKPLSVDDIIRSGGQPGQVMPHFQPQMQPMYQQPMMQPQIPQAPSWAIQQHQANQAQLYQQQYPQQQQYPPQGMVPPGMPQQYPPGMMPPGMPQQYPPGMVPQQYQHPHGIPQGHHQPSSVVYSNVFGGPVG